MRNHLLLAVALALTGLIFPARAQMYSSITELGRTADLVAFATVVQASATPGVPPDVTLTVLLRLGRVLKGPHDPETVLASIAERCASGGSGRGSICVQVPRMSGLTGLWFLKSGAGGYEILPLHKSTRNPDELPLPVADSGGDVRPGNLEDALLAYHVRWIQSLTEPTIAFEDERFFTAFAPWIGAPPTLQQILNADAPLIASSSSWQHAIGLVIALRAGSAEALTQVVNELPALQSNPRFSEIVFAIGAYPVQGVAGSKDPGWIAPLRQLLTRSADIPGMDAAVAGALYRIGTADTWPLVASLLDSKDSNAQMIAVRTMAGRVPAPLASEQTRKYYPGAMGEHLTTQEYAAFWKSWWSGNRASLGFPDQR